jgi:hypothetical protein
MADLNFYKNIFSKTNLYFGGAALCFVIATLTLGILFNNQNLQNTQASLILADANGVKSQLNIQEKRIETLTREFVTGLPRNFAKIVNSNFRVTDLTRYFDQLETAFRKNGTFEIGSIAYADGISASEFLIANINLDTNKSNLMQLLEKMETSGFTSSDSDYLFEVRSISFNLPEAVNLDDTDLTQEPLESENEFAGLFNPSDQNDFTNSNTSSVSDPVYNVQLQVRIYKIPNQVVIETDSNSN